jgi:hypothetical protein
MIVKIPGYLGRRLSDYIDLKSPKPSSLKLIYVSSLNSPEGVFVDIDVANKALNKLKSLRKIQIDPVVMMQMDEDINQFSNAINKTRIQDTSVNPMKRKTSKKVSKKLSKKTSRKISKNPLSADEQMKLYTNNLKNLSLNSLEKERETLYRLYNKNVKLDTPSGISNTVVLNKLLNNVEKEIKLKK